MELSRKSGSLANFSFSDLQRSVSLASYILYHAKWLLSKLSKPERQPVFSFSSQFNTRARAWCSVTFTNFQNNLMKALQWQKQTDRMNSNGLYHQNVTSIFHNFYLSTMTHCWESGLYLWATKELGGKQNIRSLEKLDHTSGVWTKTQLSAHFRLFETKLRLKMEMRSLKYNRCNEFQEPNRNCKMHPLAESSFHTWI